MDITEHFRYELRRDLIPAVESAFSTWTEGDVSEENLVKTRSHRAFAGLSLGSMTTYRAAFYNNFALFSWYGPFSGCCGPQGERDPEAAVKSSPLRIARFATRLFLAAARFFSSEGERRL